MFDEFDNIAKKYGVSLPKAPEAPADTRSEALKRAAGKLGVDPADLGSIISFESAGTFNPHKVGGEGNRYKGLIQFGPDEQKKYYNPNDTFESQVENGVVNYFTDRFKKVGRDTRGASLEDLYTTVIAGNPNANRDAQDSFGTSARSGTQRILKEHRPNVLKQFFGGAEIGKPPEIDFDAISNKYLGSPETPAVDFNAVSAKYLGTPPVADLAPPNTFLKPGEPLAGDVPVVEPQITQPQAATAGNETAKQRLALSDKLGNSFGQIEDQSGLQPDEVRMMPMGRENKSGKYTIAKKVTNADGSTGYQLRTEGEVAEAVPQTQGTLKTGGVKSVVSPTNTIDTQAFTTANDYLKSQGQPELTPEQFIAAQKGGQVGVSMNANDFTANGENIGQLAAENQAYKNPAPVEAKNDSEILSKGAKQTYVTPTSDNKAAFTEALHQIGAEYGLDSAKVDQFIASTGSRVGDVPLRDFEVENLKKQNKKLGVSVDNGTINDLLNFGTDNKGINPALRQSVNSQNAQFREEYAKPNLDVGKNWAEEDAAWLNSNAGKALNAVNPLFAFLDDDTKNNIASSVVGGFAGAGSRMSEAVAGIAKLDPITQIAGLVSGTDLSNAFYENAKAGKEYEKRTGDNGFTSQVFKAVGGAPGDLSRLVLLTRIGGGITGGSGVIVGMAADQGLQSTGRQEGIRDIAKHTAKGAALGTVFAAAPSVSKIVNAHTKALSGGILRQGIPTAVATPATIFVGTAGVEKMFGSPDGQAMQSAIVNTLFHLTNQGLNFKGKIVRAKDAKGNEAYVGVDKDGSIKLLKGEVAKPDVEVFVEAQKGADGVYRAKGDTSPIRTPEEPYSVGNRGNKLGTSETPAQLNETNPTRIEQADPRAVEKASTDKRVRKILDNLNENEFVSIDDLVKSTKYSRPNIEEAIMTAYGAKLVEMLPGNRVKLIGDIPKPDLFERAKEYWVKPEPRPVGAPQNFTPPAPIGNKSSGPVQTDTSVVRTSTPSAFGEWRKGQGVALRKSTDDGMVVIADPLEVKRIELSIDRVLNSITGDSDVDEIWNRIRQYIDPLLNESPQITELIKERIAAAGGKSLEQEPDTSVYKTLPQQKTQTAEVAKPKAEVITKERPDTAKLLNVFTERGTKASVEPRVISADDILTSLDEGYPEQFQPRDRSRIASKAQISKIASDLNPEFLGDSPKAGDGRPLVVPVMIDGKEKYAVISGNGRTAAIREAYEAGNEGSKAYSEFVKTKGDGGKNPVYVGVLDPNETKDLAKFANEANESAVARMSPTEQAKADADQMDAGTMAAFVPADDGSIHKAANRDFIESFFKGIPDSERGAYIQPDGSLNQDGMNRVRNAIFAKAFGDTKAGEAAIQRMAESTSDSVKNITSALLGRAPHIASYKEAVKNGSRHKDYEISNDLAAAIAQYAALKSPDSAFKSLDEYIRQGNMFGADTTQFQTRVMQVFDKYRKSPKAIKSILGNFISAADAVGDPRQTTMFGDNDKPSVESIFEGAIQAYEREISNEPTQEGFAYQGVQAEPATRQDGRSVTQKVGGESEPERAAAGTVESSDPVARPVEEFGDSFPKFLHGKGRYSVDGKNSFLSPEEAVASYKGDLARQKTTDAENAKIDAAVANILSGKYTDADLKVLTPYGQTEVKQTDGVSILRQLAFAANSNITYKDAESDIKGTISTRINSAGHRMYALRDVVELARDRGHLPSTQTGPSDPPKPPTRFAADIPDPERPTPAERDLKPIPLSVKRSMVRREMAKKDADPQLIADAYGLTVEQVNATRELGEIGKYGQMSHILRKAMADDLELLNKFAKVILPEARVNANNPLFGTQDASSAILDKIAELAGYPRSSHMGEEGLNKFLDTFADKLPFEAVVLVKDAINHYKEWYRKRQAFAEEVANSPLMDDIVRQSEQMGRPVIASFKETPALNKMPTALRSASLRGRILAIAKKYEIEKTDEGTRHTGLSRPVIEAAFNEVLARELRKRTDFRISEAGTGASGENINSTGEKESSQGEISFAYGDFRGMDDVAGNRLQSDFNRAKRELEQYQYYTDELKAGRRGSSTFGETEKTELTERKKAFKDAEIAWNDYQNNLPKAPNGKPSNLPPHLHKMVRTKAFKNWFGDWLKDPKNASQAVDENGEPKVLIHGTPTGGFTKFDTGQIGKRSDTSGIHFTDQKSVARTYSGTHDMFIPASSFEDAGGLIEEDGYGSYEIIDPNGDVFDSGYATKRQAEVEARREWKAGNIPTEESAANYEAFLNLRPPVMDIDLRQGNWSDEIYWSEGEQRYYTENEYGDTGYDQGEMPSDAEIYASGINDLVRQSQDMGDDGLIVRNVVDDGGEMGSQYSGGDSNQYIVFDSKNIKSIYNRGKFNPKDDNILFTAWDQTDLFGNPVTPKVKQLSLMFGMPAANESSRLKEMENAYGKETAEYIESLTQSADPKLYRTAIKLSDARFLVNSTGNKQVVEDAADALDTFALARQTQSTVDDVLSQLNFDGKTVSETISLQAAEFATAMEKGTFGSEFDRALYGNVQFMIAGIQSLSEKDIRRDNLTTAKAMAAKNKSAKSIWLATGWEKGKDGQWKYEIPDDRFSLWRLELGKSQLSNILDAPELFSAYPQLKELPVEVVAENDRWHRDYTASFEKGRMVIKQLDNKTETLKKVLHETQHAIQEIEGFGRGGNVQQIEQVTNNRQKIEALSRIPASAVNKRLTEMNAKPFDAGVWSVWDDQTKRNFAKASLLAQQTYPSFFGPKHFDISSSEVGIIENLPKTLWKNDLSALEIYKRLAGEVEARNVEARHNLGYYDRKATPLRDTEDVKRSDQIVLNKPTGAENDSVALLTVSLKSRKIEEVKRRKLFRAAESLTAPMMVHKADFGINETTGMLEARNIPALLLTQQAVNAIDPVKFQDSNFAGAFFDPIAASHLQSVFNRVADSQTGKVATKLNKIAATIAAATDPTHGDLTFSINIPELPNLSKTTAQEELNHRNNRRTGLRDKFAGMAGQSAIQAGLENLGPGYERIGATNAVDEVAAKSLRDDAETELGLDKGGIINIWNDLLDALDDANISDAYIRTASAISEKGKEFEQYAANRRETGSQPTKPTRTRETDIAPRGTESVRAERTGSKLRAVQENADRFAKLRQTELSSASSGGSLALRTPAEIAFAIPKYEDLLDDEPETKSKLRKAAELIYDGQRDVSIPEAAMNIIRTGYLAGFSVIKTNLVGNSANIVVEQASKPAMAMVDIINAKLNPKAKGMRYVPGLSIGDIVTGIFGKDGLLRGGFFGERGLITGMYKGVGEIEASRIDMNISDAKNPNFVRNTGVPLIDAVIEATKRLVVTVDRPFKSFARTAELRGLARIAAKNSVAQGIDTNWRKAMKKFQQDPSLLMYDLAERYAETVTFQNPNAVTDVYDKFRRLLLDEKEIAKLIPTAAQHRLAKYLGGAAYVASGSFAPFVKTPTNIGFRTLEYILPTGIVSAAWKFHKIGQGYERTHWMEETAEARAKLVSSIAAKRGQDDQIFRATTKKYTDGFKRRRTAKMAEFDGLIESIQNSKVLTDLAKKQRIADIKDKKAKWLETWTKKRDQYLETREDEFETIDNRRRVADMKTKDEWNAEDIFADVKFHAFENRQFAEAAGRMTFGTVVGGLLLLGVIKGMIDAVGVTEYDDEKEKYYAKRAAGIPDTSVKVGPYRYPYKHTPFGLAMNMGINQMEQFERPGSNYNRTGAMVKRLGKDTMALNPLTTQEFSKDDFNSWAGSKANALTPILNLKILSEIGEIMDDRPRKYWDQGFAAQYLIRIPELREQLPVSKNYIGGEEERGDIVRRFIRTIDPLNTVREKRPQRTLPKVPLDPKKKN